MRMDYHRRLGECYRGGKKLAGKKQLDRGLHFKIYLTYYLTDIICPLKATRELYMAINLFPQAALHHCIQTMHTAAVHSNSFVPRPIPSFSMLHAEKSEGLVREVTRATSHIERRHTRYRQKVYCEWAGQRSAVL